MCDRTRTSLAGGNWHHPELGRPIAAPLERCAELLGIDLAVVGELAADVESYVGADGTRIWSLMLLGRQLRPEAFSRRRGGYLDRRRTPAADAWALERTSDAIRFEALLALTPPNSCSEAWPRRHAAHPKPCRDAPGLIPLRCSRRCRRTLALRRPQVRCA